MTRIMVTGAGGYVGVPLCSELIRRGHQVVALDRFFFGQDKLGPLLQNPNLEVRVQDIRTVTPHALEGSEAVIDLAGLSNDLSAEIDPDLTRQVNFDGGASLAQAAKAAGVRRYVYASSASVYGEGLKTNLTERDECRPQTLYAKSKLHVEEQLAKLSSKHFETVIFRNATIFGLAPRMRFDLAINIMTYRAWKERVIYVMGGGQQWRPFVHVNDVVNALLIGVEGDAKKVAGETYNVGAERLNYQIRQLAQCVLDIVPNVTIHDIPDDPDRRTYNLSFEKIRTALNFEPRVGVHEGIVEIKQALERGGVSGEDPTCYTLSWYKSLIDWDKRLQSLKLDGKLF